jgi:ABC-type antimicrobial peptide transport system permease subunit
MPLLYALKHVMRSWKLFLALFVGIVLASAFFAGIDIKANVTAREALDQQLSQVYADFQLSQYDLNSTSLASLRDKVLEVNGVSGSEVISRGYLGSMTLLSGNGTSEYLSAMVSSIDDDSRVYDGWLNKPSEGIGENETYVLENSPLASRVSIGDVIAINFSTMGYYGDASSIYLELKVKGLATLSDEAYAIASGYGRWINPISYGSQGYSQVISRNDLLLVSWSRTMAKISDVVSRMYAVQPTVLIYLNREALINPWDIQSSISNVQAVKNDIQNKIITDLSFSVNLQDNLQPTLQTFLSTSAIIRFNFTVVSLPIFFMAWYVGTTVSDVSFNLRRREIGLLSTKGFSRSQILRIFLTETFLIGIIGGLIGVLLGFLLNPIFTQFSMDSAFSLQVISPYTIVFTAAFGVIIALLSTYSSARRASQLPTVDALREYMPVDTTKSYRKRLTWIALILGAYKIGVFAAGINMSQLLSQVMYAGGNFIIILLVGIWTAIDYVLNYVGPLLFFWGFTKLFIQGSIEFQALATKAVKFFGDLGTLATKNVRRNPARTAAIAFLIALIIGYSFQVTGQLASEHDYEVRQTYLQVGSDISVNLALTDNVTQTLGAIMANVSDFVKNATIETSFSGLAPSGMGVTLKAVEPDSWLKAAYYEGGWFSGSDVAVAFNLLKTKNNAIILERSIARQYSLDVGGYISMSFGSFGGNAQKFEIVGFFGPDQSTNQYGIFYGGSYWSYVSGAVWQEVRDYASSSSRILIKLKDGVNGTNIADTIRSIGEPNINYVQSFSEQWEQSQSDVITMGRLDVQRLGIVFAVLAASVGTALVSTVSLRERSREAAIMSVRGLSYKQLLVMFLAENMAIVVFSLVLGAVVGIITLNGNLMMQDTMNTGLIRHNMVFPLDTTLMLVSCAGLILAATIVPILIMARNYVTNLERMVRLR